MASPARPREVFRPFFSAGWLDGWMDGWCPMREGRTRGREESNNETTKHETNEPLTAAEKAEDERQGRAPAAHVPHPPKLALQLHLFCFAAFQASVAFLFFHDLIRQTESGCSCVLDFFFSSMQRLLVPASSSTLARKGVPRASLGSVLYNRRGRLLFPHCISGRKGRTAWRLGGGKGFSVVSFLLACLRTCVLACFVSDANAAGMELVLCFPTLCDVVGLRYASDGCLFPLGGWMVLYQAEGRTDCLARE